ncbi:hypothetical protein [Nocardioides alpinus]|nr:hypothetical protein [Nocardioides alpinus]
MTEASLAGTGGGYALGQSFAERVFPSHAAGHTASTNVELVFDDATGLRPHLAKRRSIASARAGILRVCQIGLTMTG